MRPPTEAAYWHHINVRFCSNSVTGMMTALTFAFGFDFVCHVRTMPIFAARRASNMASRN
jgi:hypothetical protein